MAKHRHHKVAAAHAMKVGKKKGGKHHSKRHGKRTITKA